MLSFNIKFKFCLLGMFELNENIKDMYLSVIITVCYCTLYVGTAPVLERCGGVVIFLHA